MKGDLESEITKQEVLEAMARLPSGKAPGPDGFSIDFLKSEFILRSNYFMFNKNYYLQTQGTSMGSPFAPNYANLFMGLWEKRYIFNNSPFLKSILFYKRFGDNVVLCFTSTEEELHGFCNYINHTYPTLRFTMEYSQEKIHFFDLLISVNESGELDTSLF